jgi:hypothetical protein
MKNTRNRFVRFNSTASALLATTASNRPPNF